MLQFLLAFVFAVATFYRESPPAVGVGGSPQEAKTHIEFLDTCAQLNWTAAQQLDKGLVFQIKGEYTVCKSTLNEKSWLVCLVGIDLTVGAIKAGVASLLTEYNKVFDGQGKLTDYAAQSCKPYDHQPVIEPILSAASANTIVQDVSSQIQSTSVVLPTPKRMVRPTHWPAVQFDRTGVFDVLATLSKFLGSPSVVCVRLWGDQTPQDLWIITNSPVAAEMLVKPIASAFSIAINAKHPYCVTIPGDQADAFMKTLSGQSDNDMVAWMTRIPDTRFKGTDCRPG